VTNHRLPLNRLPETLTDGIVILDGHRIADADAHLAGEDEEMRRRFDSVIPATLEQTRTAIERWTAGRAEGHPMFAYALRDLTGRLMGGCELRTRSANSANISFWLFPSFRGHGHAVRAVNLLLRAAEMVPGLNRLEMRIAPDNHGSRRVAEKAGFAEAGTVEEKAWTGVVTTMLFYVRDVRAPMTPLGKN
jgi:RimJ/RimL family protein N-acetyltransferase